MVIVNAPVVGPKTPRVAVIVFAPALLLGWKLVVAVPVALVVPELGETVPLPLADQTTGAPEIPKPFPVVRVTVGLHAADPAV